MSETTVLDQLLERIDSLYTLPAVAVEILGLANQSDGAVDYDKLTSVIERDSAIAAKVLRAANSPMFGFGRDVSSLTESLSILGLQALKGIVLTFSLPTEFVDQAPRDLLNDYWQQTIARSVSARQCAKILDSPDSELLFVAGLMADIGILALVQELGDNYLAFVSEARQNDHDLAEMETASLGFDHRTLSSRLMQQWNLPEALVSVVGMSHLLSPGRQISEPQQNAGILFVSDLAANLLMDDQRQAEPLLEACDNYFGWDQTQVQQWLDSVSRPMQDFAELMDLIVVVGSEYPTLLQQAAERRERMRSEKLEAKTSESPHDAPQSDEQNSPTEQSLDRVDEHVSNWAESESAGSGDAGTSFSMFGDLGTSIDDQPEGSFENWSDDPGLVGRVTMAVQNGRLNRRPLSLILAQIDDFNNLMFVESVDGIYRIQQSITVALERLSRDENGEVLEVTDERFALILPGLERTEASRMGNAILQLIRQWSRGRSAQNRSPISLSLGCASAPVPAKNFDPKTLINGAQRCLEAVQLGTGNALKSIDVFY